VKADKNVCAKWGT